MLIKKTGITATAVMCVMVLGGCAGFGAQRPLAEPLSAASLNLAEQPQQALAAEWWLALNDPLLNQLLAQTLRQSPDIQMALARVAEAEAQLGLARSADSPHIGAEAALNRQRFSEHGMYAGLFGGKYLSSHDLSLKGSWSIDFWGKHRAEVAAALGKRQALQYEAAQAQLLLTNAVLAQYTQWQHLQAQRAVLQQRIGIQQKIEQLLAKRIRAGLLAGQQAYPAQLSVYQMQVQLEVLDAQTLTVKHALAALSGQKPDALDGVQAAAWREVAPLRLTGVGTDVLGQRPDIAAQREALQAQSQLIQAARAEFYPNIELQSLVGLSSVQVTDLFRSGSRVLMLMPSIKLPIFNGGALRAQLAQRQAQYDAQVARYNQTVLNGLRDAANALSDYDSAQRQLALRAVAWQTGQKNSQARARRVQAGLDNQLDWLKSQDEAAALQGQWLAARTQQRLAWVAVHTALGGGFTATHPR